MIRCDNQCGSHGGQSLADLAYIDVDGIKNGQFRWVVQEDALQKAIAIRQQTLGVDRPSGRAPVKEARSEIMTEIENNMNQIKQEVNQQIAIESMLDRAISPTADQRRRGDEYRTYFLGINDDSQLVWSKIFKYTEGSMY